MKCLEPNDASVNNVGEHGFVSVKWNLKTENFLHRH